MRGQLTKFFLGVVLCGSAGAALLEFHPREGDLLVVAAGIPHAAEAGIGGALAAVLIFLAGLSRRRAE